MSRDDIIRMAREAGILEPIELLESNQWRQDTIRELERFAALVADAEAKRIHDEGMVTVGHMREQIAAEREACAKVCEPKRPRPCDCEYCDCGNSGDRAAVVDWDASNALAAAIRARGQA